jgi:hypothetical protein
MLDICLVDNIQIILSVGKLYCHITVTDMLLGQIPICYRYVTDVCHITVTYICHITVTDNLSHNCDRYVMGPNSYMLQICDKYFRTYILQIFYRTVTYICHISVSLVRDVRKSEFHEIKHDQKV